MGLYTRRLNLRYAKGGSGGSTEIKGVTRARYEVNYITAELRDCDAIQAQDVELVAGRTMVYIETESEEEEVAAMKPGTSPHNAAQILVLGFRKNAGVLRKLTIAKVRFVGIQQSKFDPREQPNPNRIELMYQVISNFDTGLDTFEEQFVYADDA